MSNERARKAQAHLRGLADDLKLIEQLARVREKLTTLDNRCAFYEEYYGRDHVEYRQVHSERDQLLLSADQLLQRWIKSREQRVPTSSA